MIGGCRRFPKEPMIAQSYLIECTDVRQSGLSGKDKSGNSVGRRGIRWHQSNDALATVPVYVFDSLHQSTLNAEVSIDLNVLRIIKGPSHTVVAGLAQQHGTYHCRSVHYQVCVPRSVLS